MDVQTSETFLVRFSIVGGPAGMWLLPEHAG